MFAYPFGSSYYPSSRDRYLRALAEQEERQRYEQALRQQMLRQRQHEEALRQQQYEEALRQRQHEEALRQLHRQQALRQRQCEEGLEHQQRSRRSLAQEELDPFYSMLFGEPTRLSRSVSPGSQVRQPRPLSTPPFPTPSAASSRDASPAASPKRSPLPSPAPTPAAASSVDLDTPASLIQSTWRTHRSLTTISRILSKFNTLRASFPFPTTLDFDPTTHALRYTPTNAPLRAHEHALSKILEELDAVDSWGVDKVRKERRRVVNIVEGELGLLDEKKKEVEKATFNEKVEIEEPEAVVHEEEMAVDEAQPSTVEAPSTNIEDPTAPHDSSAAPAPSTFEHPQPDADISMDATDVDAALPSTHPVDAVDAEVAPPSTSPNAVAIPLPSPEAYDIPLPDSDTEDHATVSDDGEEDEVLMDMFESAQSSPEIVDIYLPETEEFRPAPEPHLEDKTVEEMLDPVRDVDEFKLL